MNNEIDRKIDMNSDVYIYIYIYIYIYVCSERVREREGVVMNIDR